MTHNFKWLLVLVFSFFCFSALVAADSNHFIDSSSSQLGAMKRARSWRTRLGFTITNALAGSVKLRLVKTKKRQLVRNRSRGLPDVRQTQKGNLRRAKLIEEFSLNSGAVYQNELVFKTRRRSFVLLVQQFTNQGWFTIDETILQRKRSSQVVFKEFSLSDSSGTPPSEPPPQFPQGILIHNLTTGSSLVSAKIFALNTVWTFNQLVQPGDYGVMSQVPTGDWQVVVVFSSNQTITFNSAEGEFLNGGRTRILIANDQRLQN